MMMDDKNSPKVDVGESQMPQLWIQDPGETDHAIFEASYLYLVFCISGTAEFGFGPFYKRSLGQTKVFLIYQPSEPLHYTVKGMDSCRLVYLALALTQLHQLFVPESMDAPVFNPEYINRKYYEELDIPADVLTILNQLQLYKLNPNALKLFYQGKAMEILSLFFSARRPDKESCPFLNDEDIIRKLKLVKEELVAHYHNPPTIQELAKKVGLNEYQLKAGFKEVYGIPPYQYLLNHKLDLAKSQLLSGKYQVSEVADQIGYQNVSHFIAAFKRKFGVTPKKLLM